MRRSLFFASLYLLWAIPSQAVTLQIDSAKSTLEWTGSKRFVDSKHFGNVKIKSGAVEVKNGAPTKAIVVVDMTSITNADVESEKYKKMLVKHLNSDDFFNTEKHPEAKLELTSFKKTKGKFEADGKLTVRGKSNAVTVKFDNVKVNEKAGTAMAEGTLTFDRQKYGVSYRSEGWLEEAADAAKDKVIAHEVHVKFKIIAKK